MAKRKTPGLNTQSTADIAFLLLCYFLMVSTMDQQSGLQRRLPPMPEKDQKAQDLKLKGRNLFVVKINSADRIMAGTEPIEISQLKDKVKEFMKNPTDDPNMPEKDIKEIEGFGTYPVSKGIISLQNDRGTSYRVYIAVQNELVRGINELRDEFSLQNYGKVFVKLTEDQQEIAKQAIPQNISEAEPKDVAKK